MAAATDERTTVLRALIEERGLIHRFIADKLGITRSHFTRMLNAERPCTAAHAGELAALLGIDLSAFFDGEALLFSEAQEEGAA